MSFVPPLPTRPPRRQKARNVRRFVGSRRQGQEEKRPRKAHGETDWTTNKCIVPEKGII
jgi:hypothetical protein